MPLSSASHIHAVSLSLSLSAEVDLLESVYSNLATYIRSLVTVPGNRTAAGALPKHAR